MYNVIANINLALEELESHRDVITTELEYDLFKGELLGLRALLHLDLMRLYGTAGVSGENSTKLAIPYVLTFDKEPSQQLSNEKTIELLLTDLDESIRCLEAADPAAGNISESDLSSINQDGYWDNRQKHFNYYSALAVKARVMQWEDRLDEAAVYAQKVIDGALGSGFVKWADTDIAVTEGQAYSKDRIFSCEHIFSLEITNLSSLATPLYNSVTTSSEGAYTVPDTFVDNVLYVRLDPETGSLAGAEDLRGPAFNLVKTTVGYSNLKLYMTYIDARNQYPMIRLSEMYYIVAENLIEEGKNEDALAILDEVRRNRAVSDNFPTTASAADELMKEYYREFVNEGKIAFFLKHKKVESSLYSGFALTYRDLTLPYPDEELNYGRVQED